MVRYCPSIQKNDIQNESNGICTICFSILLDWRVGYIRISENLMKQIVRESLSEKISEYVLMILILDQDSKKYLIRQEVSISELSVDR